MARRPIDRVSPLAMVKGGPGAEEGSPSAPASTNPDEPASRVRLAVSGFRSRGALNVRYEDEQLADIVGADGLVRPEVSRPRHRAVA